MFHLQQLIMKTLHHHIFQYQSIKSETSPHVNLVTKSPNHESSQKHCWQKQLHSHRALNIKLNSPAYFTFHKLRSYAINNVCTLIMKCFEERNKLVEDARKAEIKASTLNAVTINFLR